MVSAKLRLGLGALAITSAVAMPSIANAHAVMMTPSPRDVGVAGNDAHKNGPCGAVPRTNKCTQYTAGATVNVKWTETVAHSGCFQWVLSSANDQNFVTLKQINDPVGGQGMVYTDTIKLPDNLTCENCTLALRQLMIGTCGLDAGANSTGPGDTYFSCADVRIGDFPSAAPCGPPPATDAGADGSAPSTPGKDSGVSTTPTDGGGKLVDAGNDDDDGAGPNLRSGDGGGCSVALGATTGVGFSAAAGLLGLALLRRRRARKN